MILEPVFDATLVEVVLKVAWQHSHLLLWLELSQADAAFVLVGENLGVPLQTVHLSEHLLILTGVHACSLRSLEALKEEVVDEAREQHCANDENYCWESTNY